MLKNVTIRTRQIFVLAILTNILALNAAPAPQRVALRQLR